MNDKTPSAEEALAERARLSLLAADVGRALTTRRTLEDMLQGCVEAMVEHLDAAFARAWVLDEAENVLLLRASAGLYTHRDGPHGRVPVGELKIGLIAQERRPHLTNAVVGDPRVSDQEWARREGMVAFAGYPLVVEDRLVGVVALFARHPLPQVTLQALGSVASQIAVGIDRAHMEDALRTSEGALRENERRLRDAQARLEAALSAGGIATWTWDVTGDSVVADADLARLFSVSPEEAASGRIEAYLRAIHPEDAPRVAETIADALAHRDTYEAEYRVVLPDGSHRWLAARGRVERDAAGRAVSLPGVVLDITERAERQRRERFLAELAERARRLTGPDEVIADALRSVGMFLGVSRCVFVDIDTVADTCVCHPDYRADDTVASMAGVSPISAFGEVVVAAYAAGRAVAVADVRADRAQVPEWSIAAYDALDIRAHIGVPVVHSARLVSCIGVHSAVPRRWESEEVALLQAVVERTWLTVEVLRQQRALVRGAEERQEARERTARILESITDAFFALDTDWRFTYVNDQSERVMFRAREDLLGRVLWDEFSAAVGTTFEREYRRAVEEGVTVTFEEFYPPLDLWVEVRAYPSPDGLSVFYQDVTARKKADAERERLLAEAQERAEREALLYRVGEAIRATADPEEVQRVAAQALGAALGVDRCFYLTYDGLRDGATVGRDFHRPGLPSLAGEYRLSDFEGMLAELFTGGGTAVLADVREALSPAAAEALESTGNRAVLSVPFFDAGNLVAALWATATVPREWTAAEAELLEQVATLTRTALEAARVSRRERAIARQLQDALQPALPEHVLGLSVGSFTRPALEEASIGGDFYDVFPLDKELSALVIGDVSGKGLAAAQQLALIRNSLRTTLYLYRAPAQAVAALNALVTAHELLVGFVTAWVGVYDAGTGRIAYASCGHEPGLVRRSGGTVEELETTGPPLGVAEGADYTEAAVTLSPGDALLLYTDGISEAGPSRRELLGTEGLSRLLSALPPDAPVQAQAELLVGEVHAYAHGVFRDDVAVLLARHR